MGDLIGEFNILGPKAQGPTRLEYILCSCLQLVCLKIFPNYIFSFSLFFFFALGFCPIFSARGFLSPVHFPCGRSCGRSQGCVCGAKICEPFTSPCCCASLSSRIWSAVRTAERRVENKEEENKNKKQAGCRGVQSSRIRVGNVFFLQASCFFVACKSVAA